MKRLLCRLGFHSWTGWHKVHTIVVGRSFAVEALYVHTRRCYDCGREEYREHV